MSGRPSPQNTRDNLSRHAKLQRDARTLRGAIVVGCLGIIFLTAAFRPLLAGDLPDVPKGAKVLHVSTDVDVYHWRVWNSARDGYEVYAVPTVASWPKYKWGAEIMLSPVPLCCGAMQSAVQWRKSEPLEPKRIAEVDASRNYRLFFRFK